MAVFDLQEFTIDGIIREQHLRDAFAHYQWETLRGKSVHLRGCGEVPIPAWAYAMAAAHLAQVAKAITYGEEANPIPIFQRPETAALEATHER